MKTEKNIDYEITKSVLFDTDRCFVLGHSPNAPAPYVTWQFTEEGGKRDYYWGHYHGDPERAEGDFKGRIKEYSDLYGGHVTEKTGVELYQYYSTQRPVDIGTFPKSINNPLLGFTNYDQRQEVEGGTMRAWGVLLYLEPLTQKQMDDYELKPATDNPDRAVRPSIAAQLKAAAQRPEPPREAAPKKHDHNDR